MKKYVKPNLYLRHLNVRECMCGVSATGQDMPWGAKERENDFPDFNEKSDTDIKWDF